MKLKLFSIIGSISLVIVLGLSGCVVGVGVDNEFQGGALGQWKLVASAPQNTMAFAGFLPCDYSRNRLVQVFLTESTGQAWEYNECKGRVWQTTATLPDFEFSLFYPCVTAETEFRFAESRLPGEVVDCRSITWRREVFYIASHYVYLRDGRILSWTLGGGFESFVRGVYAGTCVGAGFGLLFAGVFLLLLHKWVKQKDN